MAYPDSRRRRGGGHRFSCFGLTSAEEIWSQPIATDAISAPVVAGEGVYVTTMDGTV